MFSTTGTASTLSSRCTQNDLGMTAYQEGVVTISVGIVIIFLCVKNITEDIHLSLYQVCVFDSPKYPLS